MSTLPDAQVTRCRSMRTSPSPTQGPDAIRGLLAEVRAPSRARVHRRQEDPQQKAIEPAAVGERNEAGNTGITLSAHPVSHPRVHRNELSPYAPRRTRTPSLLIRSQALYPVELWARLVRRHRAAMV